MLHQIRHNIPVAFTASDDLYRAVRAALVARGSSLNAWCKAAGVNRQTVEKALKGERHSANGARLRKILVEELFSEVDG